MDANGVYYLIDDNTVISLDGTVVTGLSEGFVYLTVYYLDANGDEASYENVWLYVFDDVYWIEADAGEEVYIYLSSADPTISLPFTLYHSYRSESGDMIIEECDYAYPALWEYWYYDGSLVTEIENDVVAVRFDQESKAFLVTG